MAWNIETSVTLLLDNFFEYDPQDLEGVTNSLGGKLFSTECEKRTDGQRDWK